MPPSSSSASPSQHLYVVTGSSRGLGRALVEQLTARPGHRVVGLARTRDEALDARAPANGAALEQWAVDLADPAPAAASLEAFLAAQPGETFASATLVNNAAALTRPGPLDEVAPGELSRALRVGLEAPLLLASAFLRATRAWPGERRVLNISSGLGRRAMAGQAAYCAIKAGLDHASRALALEAAHAEAQTGRRGARIVSLAPGVIDTGMQAELRAADPEAFPDRAMFVQLQREGRLVSAHDTAARLLAFLARTDFGREPVADIREA